jgi:hypothetical protein
MTLVRKRLRSRKQWARHICDTHKATAACIEAIIKLGRTLLAAKRSLAHGEFLGMIESDLTFGARTAQMLMRIAGDRRLAKAKHASYLPLAWTALHELSKASDEAIERGISDGTINPKMTRKDASRIVHVRVTEETRQAVVPYYVTKPEQREPTTRTLRVVPAEIAPLGLLEKLERLERLVTDLCMDAQQHGGIDAGSAVERRIRTVAGKLLSLVERHEAPAIMRLQ